MHEFCRLYIPVDPQAASPNQRKHWRTLARVKDRLKRLARKAWEEAGSPVSWEPVRVRLVIRRGRVIDPDNALAGCKSIIDGIFKDAITPDDSAQWVKFYPVEQQTGKQYKHRPEVLVIVENQWTNI